MSNNWIGNIKLTNEDAVYGSDGEKILDYIQCDGSEINAEKYPVLAGKLGGGPPNVTNSGETITLSNLPFDLCYGMCNTGSDVMVVAYTNAVQCDAVTLQPINNGYDVRLFEDYTYISSVASNGSVLWVGGIGKGGRLSGVSSYDLNTGAFIETIWEVVTGGSSLVGYSTLTDRLWFYDTNSGDKIIHEATIDGTFTGDSYELTEPAINLTIDPTTDILYTSASRTLQYYKDQVHIGTTTDLVTQNSRGICMATPDKLYEGGETDTVIVYDVVASPAALPQIDTPSGSTNPYKIISDLYWYQIGDILKSNDTKLIGESGAEEFDLLLCDGSAVDEGLYPLLSTTIAAEPPSSNITSMSGISGYVNFTACSDDGVIVYTTEFNTVLKSTDSGATFSLVHTATEGTIAGLCCDGSGSILYLIGQAAYGVLYKSADGGGTFNTIGNLPQTILQGVSCSQDGSTVYIVDVYTTNLLYSSSDGGNSFSGVYDVTSWTSGVCSSSTDLSGATVFVVPSGDKVRMSVDSGNTFIDLDMTTVATVALRDDGTLLIGRKNGTHAVYTTENILVAELGNLGSSADVSVSSSKVLPIGYAVVYGGGNNNLSTITSEKLLPDLTPLDPNFPKRIVADLTGE